MFKFDRLLILMATIALCAVGYSLLVDQPKFDQSNQLKKPSIGKIIARINDVRRKSERAIAWNPIPNQENLFNQDHVFTGDRSRAEIELQNGAKLSMGANSLIVIDDGSKRNALNLELGSFLSKLKPGESLHLKRGGKILDLRANATGAEVEVSQVKKGELSITVLSGEMGIDSGKNTSKIKANEAAMFESAGSQEMKIISYPVELLSPQPGAVVWQELEKKVELRWLASPGATHYRVEASASPDFSSIIWTANCKSSNILFVTSKEGDVYWRVRAYDKNLVETLSPISIFSFYNVSAPDLIEPLNKAALKPTDLRGLSNSQKVALKWNYNKPFDHFEIEVATDKDFTQAVSQLESKTNSAELTLASNSNYFWRVRANEKAVVHFPWSEKRVFSMPTNLGEPVPPMTAEVAIIAAAPSVKASNETAGVISPTTSHIPDPQVPVLPQIPAHLTPEKRLPTSVELKKVLSKPARFSDASLLQGERRPASNNEIEKGPSPSGPASVLKSSDIDKNSNSKTDDGKSLKSEVSDSISIEPVFSFSRIDATDSRNGTRSTFLSGMNNGATIEWKQSWNRHWLSELNLGFLSTRFESPSNSSLSGSSQTSGHFGIGIGYRYSDDLAVFTSASLQQELFIRATTLSNLTFDSVPVPVLSVSAQYIYFRKKIFALKAVGSYGANLPARTDLYNVRSGSQYSFGTALERDINRTKLSVGVFYKSAQQYTSISTQTFTDVDFLVNYQWQLGKGETK